MEDKFEGYIEKGIELIECEAFEVAKEYIKRAMILRPEAPEPHNLLGILAEYDNNEQLACKHYRAAYALDPTYEASTNNLVRVTRGYSFKTWHKFDFGQVY